MVNLIDGKELSKRLLDECKESLKNVNSNRKPKLVVITVGDDDASKVYVRNKHRACENCNIDFENLKYDSNISRDEIILEISKLNVDDTVDGVMVQFPIPDHLKGIEQHIIASKDVDGFTMYNMGNTLYNSKEAIKLEACTPHGIMYMLEKSNINLEGKHVVILGRSNIVGKPLIGLLLSKNATVTSCNSYTNNLQEITKTADILISAIGKAKYITKDFISEKTNVIIDVGMNRDDEGKLCGDVNFNEIVDYWNTLEGTKFITPVPGGVGPMTVASLVNNVVKIYIEKEKNK